MPKGVKTSHRDFVSSTVAFLKKKSPDAREILLDTIKREAMTEDGPKKTRKPRKSKEAVAEEVAAAGGEVAESAPAPKAKAKKKSGKKKSKARKPAAEPADESQVTEGS